MRIKQRANRILISRMTKHRCGPALSWHLPIIFKNVRRMVNLGKYEKLIFLLVKPCLDFASELDLFMWIYIFDTFCLIFVQNVSFSANRSEKLFPQSVSAAFAVVSDLSAIHFRIFSKHDKNQFCSRSSC